MKTKRFCEWTASATTLLASIIFPASAASFPESGPPSDGDLGSVLEEITVASTPLGGFELPLDRIPGNVQQAARERIDRTHRASLAHLLDSSFGSVFINEAQGNPLQPDVQFRGFVASPLLGQPQGVAIYQNGVRINDPFGDTVNWALVPEGAIARIDLIPGSNPVFGLNALGGALSLQTKDGFTDPGTRAEVMGGSFGRVIASIQSGGTLQESAAEDGFSYYGNARYFTEDGWRDHSPSDALHLFGDMGWRSAETSINLNVTRVETDLIGNGPAPVQLLAIDRESIYTHPDRTENALTLASLSFEHTFSANVQLNSVVYSRRSNIDTLNGDESDFEACEDDADLVCADENEPAPDIAGLPISFSDAVDGATLNRSSTNQETNGASLQLGIATPLGGSDNRLIVGGSFDRSTVHFGSSTELGTFDDERGALSSGVFVGEALVGLDTRSENASVFITDTFALTPRLDLTVAARYNDTQIELRDRLGTELNGDHSFSRFNGAAGFSYRISPELRLYANYSESNRAPSPVELTCADEDDPCALPNAFLSDPPLEQVIARTAEVGMHGAWQDMRWHLGLFRTNNANDILFISSGALTNRGFFDNVGDTRREGVELNLHGMLLDNRLSWFANYTGLRARFRETFTVMSPHNPSAIDGEILVRKGATIPSVPEHLLTAGAEFTLAAGLAIRLDAKYRSSQFLRGDEGNLGSPLAGHTTINLGAQWEISPTLLLFAEVENLFDANAGSFGLYGAADEVLGDDFDDHRFVSPTAPRSAWLGIRWTL